MRSHAVQHGFLGGVFGPPRVGHHGAHAWGSLNASCNVMPRLPPILSRSLPSISCANQLLQDSTSLQAKPREHQDHLLVRMDYPSIFKVLKGLYHHS
jgi:hypothetical protein